MIITEHEKLLYSLGSLEPEKWSEQFPKGYLLNPKASEYDQKFFFIWDNEFGTPCYKASYVIGAQRVNGEELVIEPKMKNIDFMRMFSVCLSNDPSPEFFSKIYNIDLDAKPIKTKSTISASLTPLLIVHFLMLMKRITAKGLRSDYVERNEILKKVKGRIDISSNERKNIIYQRFDRVYCDYSERSINIPENRLFKRTLLLCKRYINNMVNHEMYPEIYMRINGCLAAFEGVDENVEIQEVRNSKRNTIFRDYDSAVKLALRIIKKIELSVTNSVSDIDMTPVFWIDMALLFEHYVYSLLHAAYGNNIRYQASGMYGWRPDFLHVREQLIIDAKYIPVLDEKRPTGDIVSQLGGYSRVKSFTDALGVDDETLVPCLILYPVFSDSSGEFRFERGAKLLDQAAPIKRLVKFYKIGVPMPMTL